MQLYPSNEYRATKDWPYAACAGCVVYRDNRGVTEVLLLKRDAGNDMTAEDFLTYHLPKGHIRFDETLLQAATREVAEETGCEVAIKTYLGALIKDYLYKNNRYNRTFHFFAAEYVSATGAMDGEHDDQEWVSLDEAQGLLALPNPKGEDEIIARFKKYLELTNAS